MNEEEEQQLWLELYKFISDKNNHCSIEASNTYWSSPSIKVNHSYIVSDWSSLEDSWDVVT